MDLYLIGKKALAYLPGASVMKENRFITLTVGHKNYFFILTAKIRASLFALSISKVYIIDCRSKNFFLLLEKML